MVRRKDHKVRSRYYYIRPDGFRRLPSHRLYIYTHNILSRASAAKGIYLQLGATAFFHLRFARKTYKGF